jgi:class 3 adenylate cyclase/tetratricopeptide (TPR) repeat protein
MLYAFGDYELDAARCELRRAGDTVAVEPKVFKVLAYLLAHRDRVVHKDELLQSFWAGEFMSESALTRCLTKVRRAVHDDSDNQRVIRTVRGHGYRFIAAVAVCSSDPATTPVPASPPAPMPPVALSASMQTNSPHTGSVVPGERKQVTVLVAGLKGVLALAQAVDAEVLYELLNRSSTLMQEEIQRLDGLVVQGSGEHLTALFGAPMAHEDHTIRALHAALGLQQALAAYADELQHARVITLDVGVGIHTGSVVVGTSDHAAHLDYSAQGLAIYLAERLQALASGGAICVSAAVQQQAAGFFRFDDRGMCTLPDIAQPVHVYTCTGVAPGTSRLEAFLHRYRSRFLGRERDMDLLSTLWTRARRGQGQVVLLFGEAGVGKSRLAYEFQRTLTEGRWLQAQTLSYGQSMSYHAIIPLLRALLGLTDHDTPQQQRQHLHTCLAAAQPPLAADEPLLAQLLGIPLESDHLPTLPPEEQKRRLQHACLQVILQHAAEQPLCLLIEDLHWLDNSSQELLDLVVTSSARQPVLLLGTARPGFRDSWADRSYFHRLTLQPLSDEHTDTFIHNYFQPYDASAALKALIRARTAGNPFFVEEMLRTLQEHALIVLQDGEYILKPAAHLDIPASVHGVLAARIDRLPSEAKHLLQTAAVIGVEVPVEILGAIAELSDEALHDGLSQLQAAELLYDIRRFPEHVYTFKHALTHEVAYAGLLRDRRCALHARIVEAIETRHADRLIEQVGSLAHHAFQGEVWDKAFTYLRQAGAQAVARSAYQEAVVWYERALVALQHLPQRRELLEQAIDLRFDLRNALLVLGEYERILEHLRAAETLAQTLGDQRRLGQISAYMGASFHAMGEYDQAITVYQRTLATASALGEMAIQVRVTLMQGITYYALGDYPRAIDYFSSNVAFLVGERRWEHFGMAGFPAVFSSNHLALCLMELGAFAEARGHAEEAIHLAEAANQPFSLTVTYHGAGVLFLRQGDLPRAIPLLERGLGLCQEGGISSFFPALVMALVVAYALGGRTAEALPLLEQAVRPSAMHWPVGTSLSPFLWTTEAYLLVGRLEEAITAAGRALEHASIHKERGYQAQALRLLGDIAAHGDPPTLEQAEIHYHQAIPLAKELGMRPLLAHCHLGLGTLYERMGRREPAEAALCTAIELYRALDMSFWLPRAEAALRRTA